MRNIAAGILLSPFAARFTPNAFAKSFSNASSDNSSNETLTRLASTTRTLIPNSAAALTCAALPSNVTVSKNALFAFGADAAQRAAIECTRSAISFNPFGPCHMV